MLNSNHNTTELMIINYGLQQLSSLSSSTSNHTWVEEFFAFPVIQWWEYFVYGGISFALVCFAGLCSGLTLGLLSIDHMSLNILLEAGSEKEKMYARRLEPILAKHHLLLVTLLLWNALAMETLPLFLDRMLPEFLAILLSVSFVLVFGEILPQAFISKYGLAVGGNLAWLVRILLFVAFPVAWPVSKLLDVVLGANHSTLMKRAELKELVQIHAESNEGGILTTDEISVIRGALELKDKSVESITTPLSRVLMLSVDGVMDAKTVEEVLESGHSRVPVYQNNDRQDIIGLLLIKSLIKLNPHKATPIRDLPMREIPSVSNTTQLWDLLNMFQSGKSHMVVVKRKLTHQEMLDHHHKALDGMKRDELVLGVVTLEDIMEELIQEEIVDETDVYVDMQKQERVADMFKKITMTLQSRPSLMLHRRSTSTTPTL